MDAREELINAIACYLDEQTCSFQVQATLSDTLDALLDEALADAQAEAQEHAA